MDGDTRKILSYSVYGLTLFLLYLVSTLYHALAGPAKRIFQLLDHQAICSSSSTIGTVVPWDLAPVRARGQR